jgi:hypothetical protein
MYRARYTVRPAAGRRCKYLSFCLQLWLKLLKKRRETRKGPSKQGPGFSSMEKDHADPALRLDLSSSEPLSRRWIGART